MRIKTFSLIAAASLVLSGVAFAGAKTYQVTGPVLEVNDSMITVQKGKDRWELDRDSNTKVNQLLRPSRNCEIGIQVSLVRSPDVVNPSGDLLIADGKQA